MLWPLVTHARSAVADSEGDPLLNAWAMRWVQHALVAHPFSLYDANAFAPSRHVLAFSEALLPQAVMAWPIWLVTHDALFAHNLMILVTYPLCAVAMYALCRGLGAMRGAAFIAGLCYAFAPFRLDNNSHIQVLSMQWMPLALLATIRFVQRPTRWRGVAVTVMLVLVSLSSVYYLIIFGTGLAAFCLIEAIRQHRTLLSRTGVGLLIALIAAGIILISLSLPYLWMQHEQRITRSLDEAYGNSAYALSYLTVSPGSVVWNHLLPTAREAHSPLFPGLILGALGVAGLWSVRRQWMAGIAALGITGLVLSFGPSTGGSEAGIPLPYRVLYAHVFGYQGLRGPDRFFVLVLLALCVFASLGASLLFAFVQRHAPLLVRSGLALTAVVAGAVLLDDGSRLKPTVPVDRSAETLAPYRWLTTQPDTGAIAEFPVGTYGARTAFYSTYHWHPVLWGTSSIPQAHYELRKRLSGQGEYVGPNDLDALSDMGVRTLLIHRSAYDTTTYNRIRSQLAKAPLRVGLIAQIGDCDIYHLMPLTSPTRPKVDATFTSHALANGRLYGQMLVSNGAPTYRVVYPTGRPLFTAEFRDGRGAIIAREEIAISLLAIDDPGDVAIPFNIAAPRQPGDYTVTLRAEGVPGFQANTPTSVTVLDPGSLPRLTLDGRRLTSRSLFTPDEPVALWITLRNQITIPLPEAVAKPDGTIDVTLRAVPADTARIVAHGKVSGIELWVAPS